MAKPTILETTFATAQNLSRTSRDSAKFLLKSETNLDLTQERYASLLGQTNPMINNPLNNLYTSIIARDQLSVLHLMSFLTGGAKDIPELLTIDSIVVDGKYVEATLPKSLQKPWVNISASLSVNRGDRMNTLRVTDVTQAVASITRGYLCASYNDSVAWLTPALSAQYVELYALTMTNILSRGFSIDGEETFVPKFLFGSYFASMMDPKFEDAPVHPLLKKASGLFRLIATPTQFDELANGVTELRAGRPWSMDLICELLRTLGIDRLKNLQSNNIYRFAATTSTENIPSLIAIDYPPYFVHLVLKTLSGMKNPIVSGVLNRMNKSAAMKMADQTINDRQLSTGVNR